MAIGRISAIKIEPNGSIQSMSNSLAAKGKTRYPGTGVYFLPKKELNGRYRISFDEQSYLVYQIPDKREREAEIERRKKTRERLEAATGLDLSATSDYWNFAINDGKPHIQPVTLVEGDNLFDFKDPFKEINFSFLKVHPRIASSYEAYVRGDFGSDCQFYVYDEEVENKVAYDRKREINKAIVAFDSMSLEKRKRVAKLLGLPVTDNTPETNVYNLVDNLLKQTEFKEGQYKGISPVKMFNQFSNLSNEDVNVKYLVQESLDYNIYRVKAGGAIYEGEQKVAEGKEQLFDLLKSDANQDMLLALESKVKAKKLAAL